MPVVLKNLAAVADAPVTTHTRAFISRRLLDAASPLVVANRYTGRTWTTTIYDVLAHRMYRCSTPHSIRNWLEAIAEECSHIRLLAADEILQLEIVEDKRISTPQFAD